MQKRPWKKCVVTIRSTRNVFVAWKASSTTFEKKDANVLKSETWTNRSMMIQVVQVSVLLVRF